MASINLDAAVVRAKLHGIRVNRTEDAAPGVLRVHFISSASARLAASRLIRAGYDVARSYHVITVTLPEPTEPTEATEAGKRLNAALAAMNPAAAPCDICGYTSGHWPYCKRASAADVGNLPEPFRADLHAARGDR